MDKGGGWYENTAAINKEVWNTILQFKHNSLDTLQDQLRKLYEQIGMHEPLVCKEQTVITMPVYLFGCSVYVGTAP